ncbi:phage holin family protein [Nakamurella flava]|nr:phage holin family protein [Nakamurella flava]
MTITNGKPQQYVVPGTPQASIPLVLEPDVNRNGSMGELVKDVTTHMSTLVRSEIELAKLEVTSSVKQGATGAVFFAAAGVIGAFSLFFFFFMLGEILAIWLPRWASFTIVFALMVVLAAAFAFLGLRKVKKVRKPEKTIASLEQTAQTLKSAATHSGPAAV